MTAPIPDWSAKAVGQKRVLVAGGAGFIGSHMSIFLRKLGHWVRAVDWAENEFMKPPEFCDEFMLMDLRVYENCKKAAEGCDWVFNFAADMGGMGFIQSNNAVILFNNLMLSAQVIEASRRCGVKRLFYSSSACVYPEYRQTQIDIPPLKEADAWPAQPQDAYGLEKLCTEELCKHYMKDYGLETRVARFHNIYGPQGTWCGGREKAPAAMCRKAICCGAEVPVWGDGKMTRSFCFIDDCVEGVWRLFVSDVREPINIGSDELIDMNALQEMALEFAGRKEEVKIVHCPGPEGVRGRNSDNTKIKEVLGWAPGIPLRVGLKKTFDWIKAQVDAAKSAGVDITQYGSSHPVKIPEPPELGQFRDKKTY